jgi:2-(1,2-epoxy-1,2-dihydrophenyl)acetyl-CoA isomerase
MSEVSVKISNYIAWVTLNRPDFSNAFSSPMIEELCRQTSKLDADPDVRVIVFTGAGKHFCAGGDLKAMEEESGMFAGESNELRRRYEFGIQQIPRMMESLQTPTIAMVNGAAIGAGCDFAAMSDLRIASTKAIMGETFCKLALVPGDGGTYFLPRIVGYAKAMEMFLTGDHYRADECHQMGLFNKVVAPESLEEETQKLASKIAANAPIALSLTKKALKASYLRDLQTSLDLLSSFQGITQRTADHKEAIKAFKEKRSPAFSGL